jgi:hypothetical protein
MKRGPMLWVFGGLSIAIFLFWIGINTEWQEVKVPLPPQGEAAINPFYVVQHVANELGARTSWERQFKPPSPDAIVVLSNWHWNMGDGRREAIQRWVESGGRLVLDSTVNGGVQEFTRWSGIARKHITKKKDDEQGEDESAAEDAFAQSVMSMVGVNTCRPFEEQLDGVTVADPKTNVKRAYVLCYFPMFVSLSSQSGKTPEWALRDNNGIQAMRMRVGRGSVTLVNANAYRDKQLLEFDHGRLFVAATQLRRGDEIHFLSEMEHLSLLALIWTYGAPVVILSLAVIAMLLWRGGVRFGPLAAPLPVARRSLAEQIRGTGQFAIRHGSGAALHHACVRALEEAAQRRINGYGSMTDKQRAEAVATLVGIDRKVMWTAIHDAEIDIRGPQDLRRTLALLERARRRTATALDTQR